MERKNGSEREPVRPVHVFKGKTSNGVVELAIWRNMVDNGQNSRPFYSCTTSRRYRERDSDEWKTTHSFGYDDCLVLSKLWTDAWSWIAEQLVRDREELKDSQRPTNATNNRRDRQTANA